MRAGRSRCRRSIRGDDLVNRLENVAGLDDLAVMGEPVEECRGHLGVAEDARPFAEGEIGGDDDRKLALQKPRLTPSQIGQIPRPGPHPLGLAQVGKQAPPTRAAPSLV